MLTKFGVNLPAAGKPFKVLMIANIKRTNASGIRTDKSDWPPPSGTLDLKPRGGSITLSGFADFGSFFSPAAAQKFPPAAGSGQSLFHFFASGGQSLFQKKSACGGPRAITFPFFASGGQSLFQKIPACGGLRAITFSFFRLLRSITFPKKIACGELRSITFSFFHVRGQSLFQKNRLRRLRSITFPFFHLRRISATHFPFFTFGGQSLFQKNRLRRIFGQSLFRFFASGWFSTFDFQSLSIPKIWFWK